MPYMQRTRLTADSDLDDNTTWRYKLPSVGKYTALEIRINCDRYATRASGTVVYTLADVIDKIELLIGGTQVLKSLTGEQLDAMNYWDFKRPNPRRYRQEADTGNDLILFLLAGRNLYDKEYGFDFARLPECYLEYTYDLNEDTAEYFAANDHDVKIYGYRWMGNGQPNFKGYFRDRQIASWSTSASAAIKTIAIPVGNPIRRIAVQAKSRATTLGGTFTELEVRANDGEFSPIIVKSPMDWVMAEVAEYGLHNIIGGLDYQIAVTTMDLPYWFSYYDRIHLDPYSADMEDQYVQGLITLPPRTAQTTSEAGEFAFTLSGWGFQKCLRMGFDHEDDGYDLLPTAGLGALDLIVTEAAASKDAACFVQDIISY